MKPMPQCNQIHFAKAECLLEYGHEGEHLWKNPKAKMPAKLFDGSVRQPDDTYVKPQPKGVKNET
jgi:hypothetical protein